MLRFFFPHVSPTCPCHSIPGAPRPAPAPAVGPVALPSILHTADVSCTPTFLLPFREAEGPGPRVRPPRSASQPPR